jgi:hypothetical protein
MWRWLTVIGLAMTPALIAGQSAGIAAGIGFGFSAPAIIVVVSSSSFACGLLLTWLAEKSSHVPWLKRWLMRFHRPSAVAWCEKWGPWGGLLLGAAVVGPEPILIALKWMTLSTRKIIAPLAVSSVLFTLIYYVIVDYGFDQAGELEQLYQLMFG